MTRSMQLLPERVLDITSWGARRSSESSHTTALEDILEYATNPNNGIFHPGLSDAYLDTIGPAIRLPAGNWVWNPSGTGYEFLSGHAQEVTIIGEGAGATTLTIADDKWLIDSAKSLTKLHLQDLTIQGGKGTLRHNFRSANVLGIVRVINVNFIEYTVCALGTRSTNFPYWKVVGSWFRGSADQSIGVAHPGDAAGSALLSCVFDRNRYHLKLGLGGLGWAITNSSFFRVDAYDGTPRVDVWIVPSSALGSAGQDFVVMGCKFGNEELDAADYRFLFADEAATVTDFLDTPHVDSASVGYVANHQVVHNTVSWRDGTADVPLVYSTTDRLIDNRYAPNELLGDDFTHVLTLFDGASSSADRTVFTNVWGPQSNYTIGNEVVATAWPVGRAGFGLFDDPYGQYQDQTPGRRPHGSASAGDVEYIDLGVQALSSWTLSNMSRSTGMTDAVGGSSAIELDVTNASNSATSATFSGFTLERPVFMELDLKAGSSGSLTSVEIRIQQTSNGPIWIRRFFRVPSAWRTYRLLWYPRVSTACVVQVRASATGKVQIARVHAYHAREPVNTGPVQLGTGTARLYTCDGSPEGVITASIGSLAVRTDGGANTTLYVKESGTGNTGWVAK